MNPFDSMDPKKAFSLDGIDKLSNLVLFMVYYKDQNLNISRTFLNFLILAY
jgi:hypothetical protein